MNWLQILQHHTFLKDLFKSQAIWSMYIFVLSFSFLYVIYSADGWSIVIIKTPVLWADAFYKWICQSVCLCVCSLLRCRLNVFLPVLPEVGCPIYFWDLESLGKSNEKKWSQIWTLLFGRGLKSPNNNNKKWLISPYKTWWKPRLPMD